MLAEGVADVNDAVDAAYQDKYGSYSSHLSPMIAPQARATTLKLVPRPGMTDAGRP